MGGNPSKTKNWMISTLETSTHNLKVKSIQIPDAYKPWVISIDTILIQYQIDLNRYNMIYKLIWYHNLIYHIIRYNSYPTKIHNDPTRNRPEIVVPLVAHSATFGAPASVCSRWQWTRSAACTHTPMPQNGPTSNHCGVMWDLYSNYITV